MTSIQQKRISKLIEALKNGKFEPNYDTRLKDEQDHYDILGIACQLSNLGRWENVKISPNDFGPCYVVEVEEKDKETGQLCLKKYIHDGDMPKRVVEYYGFKDGRGSFGGGDEEDSVLYDDLAADEKDGINLKENGNKNKKHANHHDTAKCLQIRKFTTSISSLAQLHDTQQMNFKQLAKFIEKAMKNEKVGLFKSNSKTST
jgi:hypothetical protein